jgi:hypothetical protein
VAAFPSGNVNESPKIIKAIFFIFYSKHTTDIGKTKYENGNEFYFQKIKSTYPIP